MRLVGWLFGLASVAFLLAWLLLFRPAFLGGPAGYVLVTGASMQPTLHGGDLVLTREQSHYQVGDVVAFRVPKSEPAEGAMLIHRIVGGSADEGFLMQGDNKDSRDPWHPRPQDIVGKKWFSIPGGARFLLRLREPMNLAMLTGGLGMLLILLPEWHLALPSPGRRRRHPAEGSEKT